jgi:hypothetical protein
MSVAELVKGTFGKTHEGALLAWETRDRGGKPTDVSTWKRVGPQQGSNPGGLFEAPDGTRYYVKFPQTNSEQVRSEQLANSIYHALDVPVPGTQLITGHVGWGEAGNLGIASKMLDAEPMTREEIEKSDDVRAGFLADAFLANHDVMGAGYDNILHGADGRDYRVDNGGSMFYRAQGSTKDFDADQVSQIDSMRDPEMAREAGRIFAGLDNAELHAQALRLVHYLPDTKIKSLVQAAGLPTKYAAALIGRRNAIADRFKIRRPTEYKVQKTHEGAIAAWETRRRAAEGLTEKPLAPKNEWGHRTELEQLRLERQVKEASQLTQKQYLASQHGTKYKDSLGRDETWSGKDHEIRTAKYWHEMAVKWAMNHGIHVPKAVLKDYSLGKTHEGALRAWETRQRAKPKAPKADASEQERRRAAAFKNFKPQTEEKELIAHESEQRVAAALGGEATTDAHPMDIWWPSTANPQVGIEVKTLIGADITNVRVNMRPACRTEKIEALGNKRGFVVLLDQRGRTSLSDRNFTEHIFIKEGMGAWRLSTMQEVKSLSELKRSLLK